MIDVMDSIVEDHDERPDISGSEYNSVIIDFEDMCKKNKEMANVENHLIPKTTEQYFYRKIFEQFCELL